MKFVIVGPGAMGCLFAGLLSRTDIEEIWLFDRNVKRKIFINSNGINITGITKLKTEKNRVKVTVNYRDIKEADFILIAVKSYDTYNAVKRIIPAISKRTRIITLQNGFENINIISSVVGSEVNIYGGITEHGATLTGYGRVIHAGAGKTIIGPVYENENTSKDLALIKNVFNNAGIMVKTVNKRKYLDRILWSKLIINSAINPVGAITGLENGKIIKNYILKDLMIKIGKETEIIGVKNGLKPVFNSVEKKIFEVCKKTAINKNSMLQDIILSKKTEIDYINGYVVKIARKINYNPYYNYAMLKIVKALENLKISKCN